MRLPCIKNKCETHWSQSLYVFDALFFGLASATPLVAAAIELLEAAARRGRVASMRALGWLFRDGKHNDDDDDYDNDGDDTRASGGTRGSGGLNGMRVGGGGVFRIISGTQRDIGSGRRFGIPADRVRAQYWFERGARTNGDTEARVVRWREQS